MRLLVNDCLSTIPGTRTFWHDLQEWFGCKFIGGDYATLKVRVDAPLDFHVEQSEPKTILIRNVSWFPPLDASDWLPTIGLLQDIIPSGGMREMQEAVAHSCRAVVFNSVYTKEQYPHFRGTRVTPLPVDFRLFEPGNRMGLQQKLMLPDGCILWVGASQGAAGEVKGWPVFLQIVRANPDLHFVAVFKDAAPAYGPPNLRMYSRVSHKDLVQIIGACRVGLCTSVQESQHLAGIEMGACGLPLVVPPVGTYWKRDDMPGAVLGDPTPGAYTAALRAVMTQPYDLEAVRAYWRREFDPEVVRGAWTRLVEEVECSGRS